MINIFSVKLDQKTTHFNQNQQVFVMEFSGSDKMLVKGKFRGKGRYVSAWVNKQECNKIEVDDSFAKRHEFLTTL